MNKVIHLASSRGRANHGWLNAHHSFSFADWYDPAKIHFGMLRVLNDDVVAPGKGFGMHPHSDMEIITIILNGSLQHKDNMGNGSVIHSGDVQVMSAGIGVMHSEFNPSADLPASLFQLWIFPKEKGIKPRYDQKTFDPGERENKIQTVASGFKKNGELYIHQDAAISLCKVDENKTVKYSLNGKGSGVYIMVINGSVEIDEELLGSRDAIGITDEDNVSVLGKTKAELLIIEVPMN